MLSRRRCTRGSVTSLVTSLDAEARPVPLWRDFQASDIFRTTGSLVRGSRLLSRAFFEHKSWNHAVSGRPAHGSEWSPLQMLFTWPHKLSPCSFSGKDAVESNSLNVDSWLHFPAVLGSSLSVTGKNGAASTSQSTGI